MLSTYDDLLLAIEEAFPDRPLSPPPNTPPHEIAAWAHRAAGQREVIAKLRALVHPEAPDA